jgi:hypothetical protein
MTEEEEDFELLKTQRKKKNLDICNDCNCMSCRFERHQLKSWIKKFHHRRTKSLNYIG